MGISTCTESVKPPRGLFSNIIRRLGLEKQIVIVKKNLGFFVSFLSVFVFLSVSAFIVLKHVLSESSFGPFLSLAINDPALVIKYWHSFILSIFESIPGITIVYFLFSFGFLILFLRFAGAYFGKFMALSKSIKKKHEYVK